MKSVLSLILITASFMSMAGVEKKFRLLQSQLDRIKESLRSEGIKYKHRCSAHCSALYYHKEYRGTPEKYDERSYKELKNNGIEAKLDVAVTVDVEIETRFEKPNPINALTKACNSRAISRNNMGPDLQEYIFVSSGISVSYREYDVPSSKYVTKFREVKSTDKLCL